MRVNNVDLNKVKPIRGGVIIYTLYNNNIFFGLGIDSKTHDITDFGGGISYKKDKNVILGSIREFNEETLNIFDDISFEELQECPVIYDNNLLLLFLRVNINPNDISNYFLEIYKKTKLKKEVCSITWFSLDEFIHIIKNSKILFYKIKNLLNKSKNNYLSLL